jgi:proteasome lid subunit RPN8/RPN11
VVYDLTGASIDIGSAEDNHIVLSGPGVEPYHLAVRQIDSRLCALVDLHVAHKQQEETWLNRQGDDALYCPEHGRLARLAETDCCPLCGESTRPLWLLRSLRAGDIFAIGAGFKATVLSQATPRGGMQPGQLSTDSPWPDSDWLKNPPHQPTFRVTEETHIRRGQAYPLDDSNLWAWDPPESPFPVFMHQRATRFVTAHAVHNANREVGGLLLGHINQTQDGLVYPVITHAIAARFATEARGHLTFTHQTWLDLIRQREEHFPNREVIGWYHTHPGLGIFLSDWDLLIQRHFFRQPWQVALVIDPRQIAAGFFVWANGDVLDPQEPHQLFRIADLDDGGSVEHRARVRIKLGGPVR